MWITLKSMVWTTLFLLAPSVLYAQGNALIAGKLCRGTFKVPGSTADRGMGSFQFRFTSVTTGTVVHLWRGWGPDDFAKLTAEVDSGKLGQDLTGFEDIGDNNNVSVEGTRLKFRNAGGAQFDLTVNGSEIRGSVDPRGIPGRENWSIAEVRMRCTPL